MATGVALTEGVLGLIITLGFLLTALLIAIGLLVFLVIAPWKLIRALLPKLHLKR